MKKGRGYDFKAFIDGTGDGFLKAMKCGSTTLIGITPLKFNLTQVDSNLTGVNFSLWDGDSDQDGFLNWHEFKAGTQENNASSTPGLDFGMVAIGNSMRRMVQLYMIHPVTM